MSERKRKHDGLNYGMRPNPGARQPQGLAPDTVEFLRQGGGLADDPLPPPTPMTTPEPVPNVAAANVPPPVARGGGQPRGRAKKETPAQGASVEATNGAPRRPTRKRTGSRKHDPYALPPTRKRLSSRSNHFRLPADVEGHLKELAQIYDCSRTHVVCSVISSEWQRLKRRQTRSSKSADAASASGAA